MEQTSIEQFEKALDNLRATLLAESRNKGFQKASDFENRARQILNALMAESGLATDPSPQAQAFPDIIIGNFGVEVKFTTNDTWRSIANSVFEGSRGDNIEHVYVLFGKMGGTPDVRWGKYEECVIHVRTSHVPRFEVEMLQRDPLFKKMGISYADFSKLPVADKMTHIRDYARGRLKEGERLWWLEDAPGQSHPLPLEVRLYIGLTQDEKKRYRAEAALLCPQIVKPANSKNKYTDPAMYLLTYHGILCHQARDLFTAGSVALRKDKARGGIYIARAIKDIETEMRAAAMRLDDALFVEYWGVSVRPEERISEWLKRADGYAKDWLPSGELFLDR